MRIRRPPSRIRAVVAGVALVTAGMVTSPAGGRAVGAGVRSSTPIATTTTSTTSTSTTTTSPTTTGPTTTVSGTPTSTLASSTTTSSTTTSSTTTSSTTTSSTTTSVPTSTTSPSRAPTTGVPKVPTGRGAKGAVKPPKGPRTPSGAAALIRAVAALTRRIEAVTTYVAQRRRAAADRRLVRSAESRLTASQLGAAATTEAAQKADAGVTVARRQLSQLAVAVYTGSTDVPAPTVDPGPGPTGPASTEADDVEAMVAVILHHDEVQMTSLPRGVARAERAERAAATRRRDAEALLGAARQALNSVLRTAAAAAAAARDPRTAIRAGGRGPTILGPSLAGASDLAGWFSSTDERARTTVRMATLAGDYLKAGHASGVRADVAFAQSVVETGYFTFPAGGQLTGRDNNFAGIGACDRCLHGWSFASAVTGVRTQLQLLEAYASPRRIPTPLLRGDPGIGGCCSTWMALSRHWATDPAYGITILGVYDRILRWVLPRRLAAAGLA